MSIVAAPVFMRLHTVFMPIYAAPQLQTVVTKHSKRRRCRSQHAVPFCDDEVEEENVVRDVGGTGMHRGCVWY